MINILRKLLNTKMDDTEISKECKSNDKCVKLTKKRIECIKAGITNDELCNRVKDGCMAESDSEGGGIVDQDRCELAWGESIDEKIGNVRAARDFRNLLFKMHEDNDDLDKMDEWIKKYIPDELKGIAYNTPEIQTNKTKKICKFLNINESVCKRSFIAITMLILNQFLKKNKKELIEYIYKNIKNFIYINNYLNDSNPNEEFNTLEAITVLKKYIKRIFQVQIKNKYDKNVYDLLSKNDMQLLCMELHHLNNTAPSSYQNGELEQFYDYIAKLIEIVIHDEKRGSLYGKKLPDKLRPIHEWLYHSQNDPIESDISTEKLFKNDGTINEIFMKFYLFTDDDVSMKKVLLQKIFCLTDSQFKKNEQIITELKQIAQEKDQLKKSLDLNNLIVDHPTWKKFFKNFIKNKDIDYVDDIRNFITQDRIEKLINQIYQYSNNYEICKIIQRGIINLVKDVFKLDDFNNTILREDQIHKEYYKTTIKISENDAELLNLAFQLHNARLLKENSTRFEVNLNNGVFPFVTPMQKIQFLIQNKVNENKARAFYNAIRNQEIHTPMYELANIINYYKTFMSARNINLSSTDETYVNDLVNNTKDFDDKIREWERVARAMKVAASLKSADEKKRSPNRTISGIAQYAKNRTDDMNAHIKVGSDQIKDHLQKLRDLMKSHHQIIEGLKTSYEKVPIESQKELEQIVQRYFMGFSK